MSIRQLTLAVAGIASIATLVAAPSPASAQPADTNQEQACADFSWLVGTWNSYSPWGDQSAPTGGSIVFTVSGNTAEGRISSLNSYMEENGYTVGMVVFRGLTDLRSFGPNGTTRFEARVGEYLQSDGETARWRNGGVGVRQNGELYMLPTAIAALSGHGPFRRAAGTTTADFCNPEPNEPSQPVPAEFDPDALIRKILEQQDGLPPVILSPDPCQTASDDYQSPDEAMQDWLDDMRRQQELDGEPPDPNFPTIEDLEYRSPAEAIQDREDNEAMQQELDRERLSNATFPSSREFWDAIIIARLFGSPAELADLPEPPNAENGDKSVPDPCIKPRRAVVVDLRRKLSELRRKNAAGEELPVHSVRNDVQGIVPGLYYGETDDEREANLRDLAERLETADANDPSRDELARNFALRYGRLEQEYLAAWRLMQQADLTDEERAKRRETFGKLATQMVEFGARAGPETRERILKGKMIQMGRSGTTLDIFEPRFEQGQTYGRTPQELAESKAGMRVQAALDRAFPQGWSYDADLDQLIFGNSPE